VNLFSSDFDALAVGDRFATSPRAVTEADIVNFAVLTGDSHPQHVDAAWASSSRFGEQIAHGLLVLSIASGSMPFDPDRVVALRRVADAVFKQPVLIGDSVHVEGEVVSVKPIDDENGLVECRWRVRNQHGRLVLKASVELVWRRAPVREPILL
jgi:3-hydroxybutyryl-CoA dehydratase